MTINNHKTFLINCSSIITSINRLIGIDCYRLSSVFNFIDCPGPEYLELSLLDYL